MSVLLEGSLRSSRSPPFFPGEVSEYSGGTPGLQSKVNQLVRGGLQSVVSALSLGRVHYTLTTSFCGDLCSSLSPPLSHRLLGVEFASDSSLNTQDVVQLMKLVEWINRNQRLPVLPAPCPHSVTMFGGRFRTQPVSRPGGDLFPTPQCLHLASRLLWTCQPPWEHSHCIVIMEVSRRQEKVRVFLSSKPKANLATQCAISSASCTPGSCTGLSRSQIQILWTWGNCAFSVGFDDERGRKR